MNSVKRKTCSLLIFAMLVSAGTNSVYALTQGQKAAERTGVKITWYDFGNAYNYYGIQKNEKTGTYTLSMSNADSGVHAEAEVNGKGELIATPKAPEGEPVLGSYANDTSVHVIRTDTVYKIVKFDGVSTTETTFAKEPYAEIITYHNDYATVILNPNGTKGIIDKNGNLIYEDKEGKYQEFAYAGHDRFVVKMMDNSFGLMDHLGTLLSDTTYDYIMDSDVNEGFLHVSKGGKQGCIDFSGKECVPLIYDHLGSFSEGFAAVCQNQKWGFINDSGELVILPRFDDVTSFKKGIAEVRLNDKWGTIDQEENVIIPIEYDEIEAFDNETLIGSKQDQIFLLDRKGNLIGTRDYSFMRKDFENEKIIYVGKKIDGTTVCAYLDEQEQMLSGYKDFSLYPSGKNFYAGLRSGDYPEGVTPPHDYGRKMCVLDAKGNNLTGFKYTSIGSSSDDFIVVMKNYYGGAGLVNRHGAEVLPTIFDDILLTDEGYAFITIIDDETGGNGRVGYFKIPVDFVQRQAVRPTTVYLDGVELYFDVEPMMMKERTMVPMRKIFESLGSDIDWNESTKTVIANHGDFRISLNIGSDIADVNGKKVQLDVAPVIENDRTLVPLRFVSENLGADVKWDGSLRRVYITTEN